MSRLVFILCVLPAMAGCSSMSALGTARTLDPGSVQYGGELITGGAVLERSDVATTSLQMAGALAVGVTEGFEVGARVWATPATTEWTWGGEVQTKIQLYRPNEGAGSFELAVAPRVSFHQFGKAGSSWNHTSGTVALMMGLNPNEEFQFIVTPQAGVDLLLDKGSTDVWAYHVGGSVGVAWKAQACTTVLPNLTFMYTSAALTDDEPIWLYQISLTLLLDG
jgi:hypothetical protein